MPSARVRHLQEVMMIANRTVFLIALISLFLTGCTSTALESKQFKSYAVGRAVTANVGAVFLINQKGKVEKIKRWVGLFNSPTGWQVDEVYSSDFVRKELVYSGKSGSTIEVAYREYRGGLAAPAFYQSVKYDLNESDVVGFQNFKFQVLDASNSLIKVVILQD